MQRLRSGMAAARHVRGKRPQLTSRPTFPVGFPSQLLAVDAIFHP
jgi:hypothetical protein